MHSAAAELTQWITLHITVFVCSLVPRASLAGDLVSMICLHNNTPRTCKLYHLPPESLLLLPHPPPLAGAHPAPARGSSCWI